MSQVFQVGTVRTRSPTSHRHATAQINLSIPPRLEPPIPKIPLLKREDNGTCIVCSSQGNGIEISDPIFTVFQQLLIIKMPAVPRQKEHSGSGA